MEKTNVSQHDVSASNVFLHGLFVLRSVICGSLGSVGRMTGSIAALRRRSDGSAILVKVGVAISIALSRRKDAI